MIDQSAEKRLQDLLFRIAHELPGGLMQLGVLDNEAHVVHDDYPLVAIIKMQHWLNLQFQSICWMLVEPTFEPVAYGMIRGLLEGWGHYWWVRGKTSEGWACRALRLDQMFAREELQAARRAEDPEATAVREQRVEHLELASQSMKCSGPTRKMKGVASSLADIERATDMNWPLLMWHQTSLVNHQVGFSWLVVDAGGINAFREPTLHQRSLRLLYATLIFSNCGELFLEITGSSHRVAAFREIVESFLSDEVLARAQQAAIEADED